jgi:hypothetical protein
MKDERPPFWHLLFLATMATPIALVIMLTGVTLILGAIALPFYGAFDFLEGRPLSGTVHLLAGFACGLGARWWKAKTWESPPPSSEL